MTITPDRIAKLREMLGRATARPWRGGHRCDGAIRARVDGERVSIGEMYAQDDAALIAAAVNDLPDLLDEVEKGWGREKGR